jgi:D-serine deaminase-like pyridoxal phosphate-dependent protein
MAAGAVGITCQKIGEAEVMARSGLTDILITFPLVGAAKAERLARLASEARLAASGDSVEVARNLSAALVQDGTEVGFLVECDTASDARGCRPPRRLLTLQNSFPVCLA